MLGILSITIAGILAYSQINTLGIRACRGILSGGTALCLIGMVAFAHLQTIYEAAGVPGDVMLYVGNGGHKYYKEGAWPFIKKYFELQ